MGLLTYSDAVSFGKTATSVLEYPAAILSGAQTQKWIFFSRLCVRIRKGIGTPNSLAQPVMLLTRTCGACFESRILYRPNWHLGAPCYHGSFTSLTAYVRWDIPWQLGCDGKYRRNTLYNLKSGHDHILFCNHFDTCRYVAWATISVV